MVDVYLDEEKIMENVMVVEPTPEGVRLVAMFEPTRIVPAVIRQVDLMENKIHLVHADKGGDDL
ncbi:MAG: CooT family nickel-binding protein [Anaerolineales bacterium]|jgi:predicted RNA-binding protein